jgi:D-alanyl-D-alanine dipeptidase
MCGQKRTKMKNILLTLAWMLALAGCGGRSVAKERGEGNGSEADSLVRAVSVSEETGPDYDTTAWQELNRLAPGVLLDLRYASTDNFVATQLYECGRCFLRPEVARALASAQEELEARGMRLKLFDCYRPRPIQWKLWEKVPDPRYVADPREGSMHNRGTAVDLTIADSLGNELDMGTGFDYFGKEAYHDFRGLPAEVLRNRELLVRVMRTHGLEPIETEWWHYSFQRRAYPLDDWVWPCKD